MKWFDNWFLKKSRWAWNTAQEKEADEEKKKIEDAKKEKENRD